jgi:predicted 3-demethylubiquinone-9 3-methyltransferase (glyoxalase superfamily)
MQKITPFLWFDDKAEEAANFYTSTFKNSKITSVVRYNEAGPRPAGSVMLVSFEIEGQAFTALNGGPYFSFTPAISFFINCETQAEVDHLWEKLSEGGEQEQCGWVKDKYGISWQVVPTILGELMQSENAEKANNVTKAMIQMHKLDIAALKRAYEEG